MFPILLVKIKTDLIFSWKCIDSTYLGIGLNKQTANKIYLMIDCNFKIYR